MTDRRSLLEQHAAQNNTCTCGEHECHPALAAARGVRCLAFIEGRAERSWPVDVAEPEPPGVGFREVEDRARAITGALMLAGAAAAFVWLFWQGGAPW